MVVESHDDFPGLEISIAGGVEEMVHDNYCVRFFFLFFFFSFFLFFFFSFFLNHMFIVSTVQEMTCIFNDMAKTKLKIKLTINKRNKHNQFPQRDQ